jgi:hypothetical protein
MKSVLCPDLSVWVARVLPVSLLNVCFNSIAQLKTGADVIRAISIAKISRSLKEFCRKREIHGNAFPFQKAPTIAGTTNR